uniref:Uncharacterized protein n=1 Tax=Arion vulgaris TaxID=1028688 RepID=A0A0B7BGC1_9EUPU
MHLEKMNLSAEESISDDEIAIHFSEKNGAYLNRMRSQKSTDLDSSINFLYTSKQTLFKLTC